MAIWRLQAVKRLLATWPGRDGPGLEITAGSTMLEVFASGLENGFAGCLKAGTAAAVAKPESPLGGCTPQSVLAGRCRAIANLKPPSSTGFASPVLPSASEMVFVPSTMLPYGLSAHQSHDQALSFIQPIMSAGSKSECSLRCNLGIENHAIVINCGAVEKPGMHLPNPFLRVDCLEMLHR